MVTFQDIKKDNEIRTYIKKGNDLLGVLGYTEHGFAHANLTAQRSFDILTKLGYGQRTVELAQIAAFMHDMGNCINRNDHAQSGALMAFRILSKKGFSPDELADIIGAIGNHDEGTGSAISAISAALILADKSDVRRSRVRNRDFLMSDIHDRVNYAVEKSGLSVLPEEKKIILSIKIDTEISAVMDYFEIFLTRMLMCRRAAEYLGMKLELEINNSKLL